ncbi:helix-turn-helix domain-containing protein [Actinoallomurus iriomotensis]|uniref:Transcriptional regulator n=1 Tax=Actinoallomurus iriomotensis TaxID=478107 RepID=A0A9W6S3M2_9ACTN|nr:helix-turn-helix transcriptional regulator [Actinoallomurus iriomotensis]GLY81133.1 transcriptional regulator [Actinoallomurus iriomotensis]GLY86474.1 transcriptional regulator [Actinoallomurus iriomotensis]
MPYTPTVRGRQLARELRHLREQAGMTGEQVAANMSWEQSKISRMETAKMRITSGEVMELCETYGVDGDKREQLVLLARSARQRDWWREYSDKVKKGFIDFLAFEAEARTSCGYEAQVIPGILQCPEYARAILLGAQSRPTDEVDAGVEVRMARQKRVTESKNPLHVWAVIDEAVLNRVVEHPSVMVKQLEHLLYLGELGNVSLQVLPYRAGIHAAIDGPFVLLTFDGYPDLLYIEHLVGCVYLEKPADTEQGRLIFDHLRSAAVNTGDSAALIREKVKELSR